MSNSNNNMEVEESSFSSSSTPPVVEPRISVHPLAIVNMADQYTRITCGGSPLDVNAPVVGLLFGTCTKEEKPTNNNNEDEKTQQRKQAVDHIEILDADDIPTDVSEAAMKQVELHQAVFSQHQVVGWYRVATADDKDDDNDGYLVPNSNDLRLTKELQQQYTCGAASKKNNKHDDDNNNTKKKKKQSRRFVFGLLQVTQQQQQQQQNSEEATTTTKTAEVPFNLYELKTIPNRATNTTTDVLMGLDDWTLQTSEPERIAVERVVREQPTILNKNRNTNSNKNNNNNNNKKNPPSENNPKKNKNKNSNAAADNNMEDSSAATATATEQQEQESSEYTTYMNGVQNSLEAMKDRIQILIDFLEKTRDGTIPVNYSLLRQVHALLLQLGPLANGDTAAAATKINNNIADDSTLLSHMAAVAKTIHSVYNYTEKFKTVHENRPSHPGSGGPGGGGPRGGHRDHREGRGRY